VKNADWGSTPNRRSFGGVFQRPSACHLASDEAFSEVNARTDAADISKILAEAETMLFGLILTLIKRPEIAESVLATAAEGRGAQ
jgi:hypothetical protein